MQEQSVQSLQGSGNEDSTTSPLSLRLGVECLSGIAAAFSVSPAISIVDKAITCNASGREPLMQSVSNSFKSLISSPFRFIRQPSFLLIWGVFSGTYMTANSVQAICEHKKIQEPKKHQFACTSMVNVTLSVLKDKAFAKMFGTGPIKPLPWGSYSLFATRDAMTMLATFTMPAIVQEKFGVSANTAQLVTPCAMQFLSCPLHLYGLDLYNRQGQVISRGGRLEFIAKEYLKTTFARCARILPAFGIGGVINREARLAGNHYLERRFAAARQSVNGSTMA